MFHDFYGHIKTPVLIYQNDRAMRVAYENHAAALMLNPLSPGENWSRLNEDTAAPDLLKLPDEDDARFEADLKLHGSVKELHTMLLLYNGVEIPVALSASIILYEGNSYVLLLIEQEYTVGTAYGAEIPIISVLKIANKAIATESAIQQILAFAGRYTDVSRVYIIESVSKTMTSNTYEWCGEGIQPEIQNLQQLDKNDYSYDELIRNGIAITDDIRKLSRADRDILEPQGIKSLAIIPIFSKNKPLGYVGFDDCSNYRTWSPEEVVFLQDLADMLGSLMQKRNTERQLQNSREVLSTVTNHMDHVIYVTDYETNELLFVNKPLVESLQKPEEELLGKTCWKYLQKGMDGPCEFCPLKHMLNEQGEVIRENYTWEFRNTHTNKWYLVRDSIIKWIDGRNVHMETATEITKQKEYEKNLEHVASTDMMTGAYNREWGRKLIERILTHGRRQENALIFIDLDNLKQINDQYGHAAGDNMILKIVEIIQRNTRKSDVLCRWGGDEFVMVVRGDLQHAEMMIQKVQGIVRAFNREGTFAFSIGFSYGIVEIEQKMNLTVDQVISKADKIMYRNKMETRGQSE